MAMRASEVMGADVDEDRMTCKKGWSIEGVSKVLMSRLVVSIPRLWFEAVNGTHLCSP